MLLLLPTRVPVPDGLIPSLLHAPPPPSGPLVFVFVLVLVLARSSSSYSSPALWPTCPSSLFTVRRKVVLRIRPTALEVGDIFLCLLWGVSTPPVLITSHVVSLSRLISLFSCAPLAASSPCLMSGLTGNGMGGLGGLGGARTVFVFVIGIAPACWDACRGGGRILDLRGGRGGTGVDPAMIRGGEEAGTGMAGFFLGRFFLWFFNGFWVVFWGIGTRDVGYRVGPFSLERVGPFRGWF